MNKLRFFLSCLSLFFLSEVAIDAHCQMPCGIYHDQMIYDKIDEYFETMMKAVAAMNDSAFKTAQEKNQFIRWVMTKDQQSDEVAEIILKYFLQQKLKPNDEDTFDLVKSAHKMLFLLVQIKQNCDPVIVKEFGKEWDHFKELFHPELECHIVVPKAEKPKTLETKNEVNKKEIPIKPSK